MTTLTDAPPVTVTPVCSSCGQSDRLLIPSGTGWLCLNVDRCHP